MTLPQCMVCKWYTGKDTCKAFPEGIPEKYSMANPEPWDDSLPGELPVRMAHLRVDPAQVGDYVYRPK